MHEVWLRIGQFAKECSWLGPEPFAVFENGLNGLALGMAVSPQLERYFLNVKI